MNAAATVSHPKDIEYVTENFETLDTLCRIAGVAEATVRAGIAAGTRPRASYTLADGREFFARDYLSQCSDPGEFRSRAVAAAQRDKLALSDADIDDAWQSYLTGVYSVCLNEASPENIVRKRVLVERIEKLIAEPREYDVGWFQRLHTSVDALDALERPFSPYYDRVVFGRPPTRDSHIRDVRLRFGL